MIFFRLIYGGKMVRGFEDADKMREHIFKILDIEGDDFFTKYDLYYYNGSRWYPIKLINFLFNGTIEEEVG